MIVLGIISILLNVNEVNFKIFIYRFEFLEIVKNV